ncbi:MAG: acyltransferase [Acidobacteriaceae bacterium]|nr:acyltransferase [Acidobacteriaceae bacterium]
MNRQSSSTYAEMPRIPQLDGLRGIAILLVLFHHCTVVQPGQGGMEAVLSRLANIGPHGVDLFFVLSGFLITGILLDTKSLAGYFRKFYTRRALRIFPLYYLIVLVCVVVLPFVVLKVPAAAHKVARLVSAPSDWPWYVLYLSNFLIAKQQNWVHPVLGVTWSLAIEEQFYLVWAPIVFLLDRSKVKTLGLTLLGITFCARWLMLLKGYSWIQLYVLPWCRMDGLALGALIAVSLRDGSHYIRRFATAAKWIAIVGTLFFVCLYTFHLASYDDALVAATGYGEIALVCAAWLVVALNALPGSTTQRVLSSGFLRTFGKYSYAIYLLHLPIRAALRDTVFASSRVQVVLGHGILWQLVFYIFSILAALIGALLTWNLIERPCLSLKNRLAEYNTSRDASFQLLGHSSNG